MPIRIFGNNGTGLVSDGDISAGIDYAIQNGVSIFNGSFGADPEDDLFFEAPNVNQIIDAHKNSHVFVFASGNNGGVVHYPGYLDGVITVGAVDQSDAHQNYSASGLEMDIVAPSGGLSLHTSTNQCLGILDDYYTYTLQGNVWSIDQDGTSGWNPGDTGTENNCRNTYNWNMPTGLPNPSNPYTAHFGGTSAAAPQVSGVVALMNSVNAALTPAQIRTILQNTADWSGHMGGSPPSNQYGHGRLNAFEAVKHALPNQYSSHFFAHSGTFPIGSAHIYGESYLEFGTLSIPAGAVSVIDGNFIGFGSTWAKLEVTGRLVVTEGTQISDMALEVRNGGEVIISKDANLTRVPIAVEAGGQILVQPGAQFAFGANQGLVVHGQLQVSGTPADRVEFTGTGSGTWEGIELYGNGSTIGYADIESAVNGISVYNNANTSIANVQVTGSSWDGIRLINASNVFVSHNRLEDNGRYGIYYDGQYNDGISNSVVDGNYAAGLRAGGGAMVWGTAGTRISGGNNGLWAVDASTIYAVLNNISGNSHRDVMAHTNSEVMAQENWWGTAPPSSGQFEAYGGSVIDYSNWLSFNPVLMSQQSDPPPLALGGTPGPEVAGGIAEPEGAGGIAGLRRALHEESSGPVQALEMLDELGKAIPSAERGWVDVIRMELLSRLGRHEEAIQTGRELLDRAGQDEALHRTVARRLFYSYVLGTGDGPAAGKMLALLVELECDEALDGQLARVLQGPGADQEPRLANGDTERSGVGVVSYPNPFNPSTVIRYELPEAGNVRLSVYDMTGRRVADLVNGPVQAGSHTAGFDGSRLASGVYVYRLQSGGQVLSGKMMLVK
jgi:hypothetical protein